MKEGLTTINKTGLIILNEFEEPTKIKIQQAHILENIQNDSKSIEDNQNTYDKKNQKKTLESGENKSKIDKKENNFFFLNEFDDKTTIKIKKKNNEKNDVIQNISDTKLKNCI